MRFKGQLKRPCSEMGFEKFFDSHIGKLKMIKGNGFDTDCKNE